MQSLWQISPKNVKELLPASVTQTCTFLMLIPDNDGYKIYLFLFFGGGEDSGDDGLDGGL